uniref:Uncharacterized protein n=1 Tax=Cacopsylla melanoneura TaxID=428564 RepID=A0A8D8R287_9HEMI
MFRKKSVIFKFVSQGKVLSGSLSEGIMCMTKNKLSFPLSLDDTYTLGNIHQSLVLSVVYLENFNLLYLVLVSFCSVRLLVSRVSMYIVSSKYLSDILFLVNLDLKNFS